MVLDHGRSDLFSGERLESPDAKKTVGYLRDLFPESDHPDLEIVTTGSSKVHNLVRVSAQNGSREAVETLVSF